MVRVYMRKGSRSGVVNEEDVQSAIKEVLEKKLSIRKSGQKYGIKPATLHSRLKNYNKQIIAEKEGAINRSQNFSSKYTSKQVFTTEQETLLSKFIRKCSKIYHGLTLVQVRELAYEYASANNIDYPRNWNNNKMAGKDWLDCFRTRNPNLDIKNLQNSTADFDHTETLSLNKINFSQDSINKNNVLHSTTVPDDKRRQQIKTISLPQSSNTQGRIDTVIPEMKRLIKTEKAKDMKKSAQERNPKTKDIKRTSTSLLDLDLEKEKTEETDISLREKACSSFEETSESDIENEIPIGAENIKANSFLLVKLEEKNTVIHSIGQVVAKYSQNEYKVSFMRRKPGTWKFVFPNIKDERTIYLSDVVYVLPPPEFAFTKKNC